MTAQEVEAIVEDFCNRTGVGMNLQITGSQFPFKAAALGALFRAIAERSQARVNAEREACAKICDKEAEWGYEGTADNCAIAIRART